MAANKPSESALLDLVDPGDDEINISSGNMNPNEDTFIDMNDDTEALLGPSTADLGDIDTPAKQESSVFSFGFYQRLFDVDTEDIVARLAWSALPRPKFTSNLIFNSCNFIAHCFTGQVQKRNRMTEQKKVAPDKQVS